MTYQWLTWLAEALRAEGCTVVEESGWKTRGRPASTGDFAPYGVLWHHTGTHASYSNPFPTRSTLINGRSDLPGPLAQVGIGYDGKCHVIAAGRANHAGECNGFGPFSSGDGNRQLVGFEIDYDGTQSMSPEQKDAATRASAACLKRFARPVSYAARHAETSTTGKWDTGGVTGDQIRSMISSYLDDKPAPVPPPPPEDDMPALMLIDSTGADGTIYSAPIDLSSKTALTKAAYDALVDLTYNGKGLYLRVKLDPATLKKIPAAS